MLLELGINVLQLQYEVIDAAFDNYKNDIQGAAYSVLSTWYEVQTNKHQAFMDLYSAIQKSKIKLFATELCAWVERDQQNVTQIHDKGMWELFTFSTGKIIYQR